MIDLFICHRLAWNEISNDRKRQAGSIARSLAMSQSIFIVLMALFFFARALNCFVPERWFFLPDVNRISFADPVWLLSVAVAVAIVERSRGKLCLTLLIADADIQIDRLWFIVARIIGRWMIFLIILVGDLLLCA